MLIPVSVSSSPDDVLYRLLPPDEFDDLRETSQRQNNIIAVIIVMIKVNLRNIGQTNIVAKEVISHIGTTQIARMSLILIQAYMQNPI